MNGRRNRRVSAAFSKTLKVQFYTSDRDNSGNWNCYHGEIAGKSNKQRENLTISAYLFVLTVVTLHTLLSSM